MIELRRISIQAAEKFIDFAAGSKYAEYFANTQLEGAVAAHNILADGKVVYLGDEVGMGKTYVALGTVALIRHFHPSLRVLYVVPKENLQEKWIKETNNFASQKWKVVDHRVKTIQGTCIAEPVKCENLLDLVKKAAISSNRDFILRLTSFSFGLRDDWRAWKKKAEELQDVFPGLSEAALRVDGRSLDKEDFKDKFACAVNSILPHFDLLVVDEGHNLKRGYDDGQTSTRNRLLAMVLGTKPARRGLGELQHRMDRAIILSATPVDRDYKDLWNQLDLLGLADGFEVLASGEAEDADCKAVARKFMIRRLTDIKINGVRYTKNMYRREWRGGGVDRHDDSLQVPDNRQRLIVALMQKKVADLMAAQGRESPKRFSRSFQIGMLASFESFGRTAKVQDSTFDQADQTEVPAERQGLDTRTMNDVAASYRLRFQDSLPHPKMDAVVDEAWKRLLEGRKTLIFVRRIHSVPEMVEKLTKRYDDWLRLHILERLPTAQDSRERFNQALMSYDKVRNRFYTDDAGKAFVGRDRGETEDSEQELIEKEPDAAKPESFFSWFFRGEGPDGILSGARFQKNRLQNESASLATFFEDNWVLWLLDYPSDVLGKLSEITGMITDQVREYLRCRASELCSAPKLAKLHVFRAYQKAALELLAEHGELADKAKVITVALDLLPAVPSGRRAKIARSLPEPEKFLNTRTFFTELAGYPELCKSVWPAYFDGDSFDGDLRNMFLLRERMRLMLSSAIRLGHPLVDLWLLYVNLIGGLAASGKQAEESESDEPRPGEGPADRLAREFVNELDRQRAAQETDVYQPCFSWLELSRIGQNFDLISNVNFPGLAEERLGDLARILADKMGQQQPIIGMYGSVNRRAVSQFRMPGYPYVLVATDVLQEGEDLHTFCARIMHYGITWTASAMEQRTGRVDRIGSLVHRQLRDGNEVRDDNKLQVYFPYLADTWEYVQVTKVFQRLNRFMKMMHELKASDIPMTSRVDVSHDIHEATPDSLRYIEGPLKSDFDIARELLQGDELGPDVLESEKFGDHFRRLVSELGQVLSLGWTDPQGRECEVVGTMFVCQGRVLRYGGDQAGSREQRFKLGLRTTHGGRIVLFCRSTVGSLQANDEKKLGVLECFQKAHPIAKICARPDDRNDIWTISVTSELLFSPDLTQLGELSEIVTNTVQLAHMAEDDLFGSDHPVHDEHN